MRYRLPQTIRRKALLESLKGKVRDQELVVLDQLSASEPKTRPFAGLATTFQVNRRSVIVLHDANILLVKSLRNLAHFQLCHAATLNALHVLNAHKVLVTKSAFEQLSQRVREPDASSN
jgi:large subunit ribosomal protein L4